MFDRDAMERKIAKNMDAGHSLQDIKRLLLEEQLELTKNIRVAEARCVELADQIAYIRETYG